MRKPKKIVVVGNEDVLSASIALFLARQPEWRVISVSRDESLHTLAQTLACVQPDIVIVRQDVNEDLSQLPLQVLHDHPSIKVIMISLEGNQLDVYCKTQADTLQKEVVMVEKASDLIILVGGEQASSS